MTEHLLLGLASIIVVGTAAQWIAWRVRIPSILLLLIFGFVAGPVTGLINPDTIFGGLLFPVVSLSVAIILFEGGLSLNIAEYKETGGSVHSLITVGAFVTWVLTSLGAYYILDLGFAMSILIGAILVVSGPTVVIPLINHIRPTGAVSKILRWEGILIDPLGAVLAVLVYEVVTGGVTDGISTVAIMGLTKTIVFGGGIGIFCANTVCAVFRRFWLPDHLKNPVVLMVVVAAFTASNMIQGESGLLAVTVMGIAMANQRSVAVKSTIEFVESLRVLLLSLLFIVLAARLDLGALKDINLYTLAFLAFLIFIVRPASVFLSTLRAGISTKEKLFLSLIFPRGIVAAAVASIFAIQMIESGLDGAEHLVPVTFFVIVGTVAFYGLLSPIFAKLLKVAQASPQGMLVVGATTWAVAIAKAVQEEGFKVALCDTNRYNIYTARLSGLDTHHGSIISHRIRQKLNLEGVGRILALTPNDGVNSLSTLHFSEVFGTQELYQLVPKAIEKFPREEASLDLHGRFLFGNEVTYTYLSSRFSKGGIIKKTQISEKFDFAAFKSLYGEKALPLFIVTEDKKLQIFTADKELVPKPGQTLISLVEPLEPDAAIPIDLIQLNPKKKNKEKKEDVEQVSPS